MKFSSSRLGSAALLGASAGGNVVEIIGAGFTASTAVSFGAVPASVQVVSGTRLEVVVPPHRVEPHIGSGNGRLAENVTVTTEHGEAALPDGYTYLGDR